MNTIDKRLEEGLKLKIGKTYPLIKSKCTMSFGDNTVLNYGDTVLAIPVKYNDMVYGYELKTKGRRIYLSLICHQCTVVGMVRIKYLRS